MPSIQMTLATYSFWALFCSLLIWLVSYLKVEGNISSSSSLMLIKKFIHSSRSVLGFPGGSSCKEPLCQCRRCKRPGFNSRVGKIPWRRAWQPTPVFLPGESSWREEPDGLQSMRSQRVGHDWHNLAHIHLQSLYQIIFHEYVSDYPLRREKCALFWQPIIPFILFSLGTSHLILHHRHLQAYKVLPEEWASWIQRLIFTAPAMPGTMSGTKQIFTWRNWVPQNQISVVRVYALTVVIHSFDINEWHISRTLSTRQHYWNVYIHIFSDGQGPEALGQIWEEEDPGEEADKSGALLWWHLLSLMMKCLWPISFQML